MNYSLRLFKKRVCGKVFEYFSAEKRTTIEKSSNAKQAFSSSSVGLLSDFVRTNLVHSPLFSPSQTARLLENRRREEIE